MKNQLIDLNNHLFAAIERLSDEDISGDDLKKEISRSKALSALSKDVIANARLALDAKLAIGVHLKQGELPTMIESPKA
ncbi:hypothetical protein A6D98_09825 [Aliivibrio fischeri]|uniref:Uncharacterized protein n=1 Tax=Aliivibrio phage vB_Alvi_H905 TaxID=3234039 RepID=A0AB39C9P7_9VIRU|nr:hypothetical protein [Aliivibrio fischeri]OCH60889.1 hypothetical protein A6D98_09825 [Aliivibrio fischeri]